MTPLEALTMTPEQADNAQQWAGMDEARKAFEAQHPIKRFGRVVSNERYESMEVEWAYRGYLAGRLAGFAEAREMAAKVVARESAWNMDKAIRALEPK